MYWSSYVCSPALIAPGARAATGNELLIRAIENLCDVAGDRAIMNDRAVSQAAEHETEINHGLACADILRTGRVAVTRIRAPLEPRRGSGSHGVHHSIQSRAGGAN